MKDKSTFDALLAHERALVAIAVLLDGRDAATFLGIDSDKGDLLQLAAEELTQYPPELRMPYVGTLLRTALRELR
jgi:hypothetical protein